MRSVVWEYDNVSYTLTQDQAKQVDDYSDSEKDNRVFNKWFLKYARENKVPSRTHGRASWWSRVPDSKDDVSRLVSVKQSALTLMRVVDPDIKVEDITFDKDRPFSIPSEPAREAPSLHEALDNTAGFTIHSAFKSRFSGMKPNEYALAREVMVGRKQGKEHVYDALVTMRSNYQGLQENPGFADYIDNAAEYVYNGYTIPEEWPSKDINAQIAALMAPSLYGSRVGDVKGVPYSDKVAQANEIIDKIIKGKAVGSTAYLNAVNNIYDLLDAPGKDEGSPQEGDEEGDGEAEGGIPVPMSITATGNFKTQVNLSEEEEVNARVEMDQELLEKFGGGLGEDGVREQNLIKVRPQIHKYGDKIPKLSGSIVKADAHLRLKKTLDKRTEHFQRSGDLDEDELYRLYHGDDRVFMNVEEEQEESASIHFLIDASGSMRGGWSSGETNLVTAAQLSWLFAHSMNKRAHVKSHVWAHTGDTTTSLVKRGIGTSHAGPIVFDIWKTGEDLARLDMTLSISTSENYDGFAIQYVGDVLHKEDAMKKYLIVLSDGYPAGTGYGGVFAMRHVRKVTDGLAKKGIYVVQIAIGGSMVDQGDMFKNWVPYKNVDQMIREFAKILDKAR